jgi:glycosyltransferase involved in cell wall biosynthesis
VAASIEDWIVSWMANELNVLMVTGVYLPEVNGAVRQCSQLINNLRESVNYSVLTGTSDESISGCDCIDGVLVTKVFMPKRRKFKYVIGAVRFFLCLTRMIRGTDLVHIHGFSKRNAVVILITWIFGKRIVIKMTSYGHDDPLSIKNDSFIFWILFKFCHAYVGISPAFWVSYKEAGLLENKYSFIPNGVDLDRYSPISINERKALKVKYGFAEHDKLIIFVGHFSPEKRPMLLYRAWTKLCEKNSSIKLIFIGHTRNHFEVDEEIVEAIRQDALQRGTLQWIRFVDTTPHVDEYMKMADVFVLPSIREGLPNVLLEAMACALPCVVSDLPGVTDWLLVDGETGILFRSDDPDVLAGKIAPYVLDNVDHQKMGLAARQFMEGNFSSASTSQRVLDLYRRTMGQTSRVL